jgi:hypothetical protein
MVSRIVVGCVLALGLAVAFLFSGNGEVEQHAVEKTSDDSSSASSIRVRSRLNTVSTSDGGTSRDGSRLAGNIPKDTGSSAGTGGALEAEESRFDGLLEVTNMRRPSAVAMAALKALQHGSFEALLTLTPPSRLEGVRKRWGPGTLRHEELFGEDGWQQRTIQSWKGELLEVRVKRGLQVLVKYGEIVDEGVKKHLCVSLLNIDRDGHWYFKNLDARPNEEYSEYGEVVAVDYVLPQLDTKP